MAALRIAEAAQVARDALAEQDDCKAAVLWQKLLGSTTDGQQVFPTPEYCNADGTTKDPSETQVVKGSLLTPAGTGRYA
jgi:hypothetical protein